MTVVNPKSISGINSITTGSGSDDILTIHNNNGTERLRIDSTGTTRITTGIVTTLTATSSAKVGTGVTLSPDGDIFATGVCTATSFVGSGANLTGISGVSVANQSDNRVITNTGTTDALNAEANLTFDGSDLTITNSGVSNKGIKLTATGSYYPSIVFDSNRSGENQGIMWLDGKWNGTSVGAISIEAGDDTTNKDDGKITFYTTQGGTMTRKMAIEQDGDVHIDDGDLVIGTSGHGIDFSATGNAGNSATVSNELFDDYEEGTWVPTARDGTLSYTRANYTKIGRMVHVSAFLNNFSDNSTNDSLTIQGIPFSQSVGDVAVGSVMYEHISDANRTVVYLADSRNGFTFYGGDTGGYDNIRYNELGGSSSMYMQATYFAS